MFNRALLSVQGLYSWDNTIFDLMQMPEGVDKDMVVKKILLDTCQFSVIYPDPDGIKRAIQMWSFCNQYTFKTLWDSTQQTYNPIDNFNRKEEWTENVKRDETFEKGTSTTSHSDGTVTPGNTSTTQESVSAFNISGMTDRSKSVTTAGGVDSSEANVTTSNSGSDKEKADNSVTHTGHLYGNIGVTTTQQMLEQERQIALFNFYDFVVQSFKMEFCVMVY